MRQINWVNFLSEILDPTTSCKMASKPIDRVIHHLYTHIKSISAEHEGVYWEKPKSTLDR